MTKLYSLLLSAFFALGAAATDGVTVSNDKISVDGSDKNLPELQFITGQNLPHISKAKSYTSPEMAPFDCDITVSNITDSYAFVTVTPKNASEYYIFSCCGKEQFDNTTEYELTTYLKENMDYYIELYAENGYAISYSDFCSTGVKTHEYSELQESTEYVVFAYSVDTATGLPTSSFAVTSFTTNKGEDVVITDEVSLHVVSPKWTDKVATSGWWQITGYTADGDYWVTLSNSNSSQTAGTYHYSDLDLNYSKVYKYDDDGQPVEIKAKDITVDVAVGANDAVTVSSEYLATSGKLYHLTFDTIFPDGIKNISVSNALGTKKYLENNSIIIEKNGEKFNAAGQLVK